MGSTSQKQYLIVSSAESQNARLCVTRTPCTTSTSEAASDIFSNSIKFILSSVENVCNQLAILLIFIHDCSKKIVKIMFGRKKQKVEQVRLNKFIASSGLCSRRKADELIESGAVKVNGRTIDELGYLVTNKDKVLVNGQPLKKANLVYVKYYKPAGYITTMNDEKGTQTNYDILPAELKELKPVGRLDKDSTGLLILTNDGDFINKMTHPSIKIPKIYRVCAQGRMNTQHLIQMAKGIEIEQGKIAYADSSIIEYDGKNTVLQVILYQGMNRQIRKMLDSLGFPVISLKRISHGTINIQGMKKGQFKYIKPREISDMIKQIQKLEKQNEKDKK